MSESIHRVAVYGASGFGRQVMPYLRRERDELGLDVDLAFVDDAPSSGDVNGVPRYSYEEWITLPAASREVVIAIADSQVRERLTQRCAADGVALRSVRGPHVVELDDVVIGEGAVLCASVVIDSNVRIGRGFQANVLSHVAHDCVVGDFVTLAPGAICNGNVHIGDHAYIGAGATIKQGRPGAPLTIGAGSVIGMGAVVTRAVPPNVTVVGNPARSMTRR